MQAQSRNQVSSVSACSAKFTVDRGQNDVTRRVAPSYACFVCPCHHQTHKKFHPHKKNVIPTEYDFNLIFRYHHVTVCIYCWFAHGAYDPSSRWFCTMNYLVHSLMYSYYALRVSLLNSLYYKLLENLNVEIMPYS